MTHTRIPENKNKALLAIFACVAMYGFTLGLGRPLLALILEARGIDRSIIGLNAAMPAIGIFISTPFIPLLVEKLGMRRFLVLVLAIDLVVLLQFPRFDHLYAWFFLGIFLGAMANCLLVTSETWINEIVGDANRGRLMGLYNALLAATVAMGPLVIPAVGIQGWTPFLVGACFIALAALPLLWAGPHRLSTHDEPSFNIISFLWVAPTLVAAVLLFSLKETAGNSLLPVYGTRSGMSEAGAAIMLTVIGIGGVTLSYPMGVAGGPVQPLRPAGVLRRLRPGRRRPAALCHAVPLVAVPVAVRLGRRFCRHVHRGADHHRPAFPRQGPGDGKRFPGHALGCGQPGLAACNRRGHGYPRPRRLPPGVYHGRPGICPVRHRQVAVEQGQIHSIVNQGP